MATNFGSAITVVGPIGTNEFRTVNVVVDATAGVTGPHAITSGSWNLSVGDNLIVNSAATGVTGYGTGTTLIVAGITYAPGTAGTGTVFFDAAATGTDGYSSITVGLADTSLAVPTFSAKDNIEATYSSMNKLSGQLISNGQEVELFSWKNQNTTTNKVSMLVTVDSITNSAGVAIANASVLAQLSSEPNALTVNRSNLAVLRAGDSFYTSNLNVGDFYGGNSAGSVTQPVILLRNPSGANYYVTATVTIGS